MLLVKLFALNAIAHIISFVGLNKAKSPNRIGVLAFVFINAAIGLLLFFNVSWSIWLALIFPAIGVLALLFGTLFKGNGKLIDYIILILDIVIIIMVIPKL